MPSMPQSPPRSPTVSSIKPPAEVDPTRSHHDQAPSYPSSSSSDDGNELSNDGLPGDIIDMEIFRQILDLDEDDTYEFSKGMAYAYFSQAEQTFEEMDQALSARDLTKLSSLGHFLKGSSAALGVTKVQASCERMQHYGQHRDELNGKDLDDDEALGLIQPLLSEVKLEYKDAKAFLELWYSKHGGPDDAND